MNLKKSIEKLAHLKEMKLGEYAEAVGIAQSSISTIKSTNKCHTDTLQKLALDMPLHEFIKIGMEK